MIDLQDVLHTPRSFLHLARGQDTGSDDLMQTPLTFGMVQENTVETDTPGCEDAVREAELTPEGPQEVTARDAILQRSGCS